MTHHHGGDPLGFTASAVLWFGMMAAMMAPTVWPWVRSFHRFGGATLPFAFGYLAAWLAYSLAAAAVQELVRTPATIAPAVFVVAGLWQFAPLKRACLDHCRNPIGYFLARWRNGPAGGFRMGLDHGAYCVGCCWAIMATMIVVGMTAIWWMTALAAVTFVEQIVPRGDRLRIPLGFALIAAAFV